MTLCRNQFSKQIANCCMWPLVSQSRIPAAVMAIEGHLHSVCIAEFVHIIFTRNNDQEQGNDHDRHAVVVHREGEGVLGHLPHEISSVAYFFSSARWLYHR